MRATQDGRSAVRVPLLDHGYIELIETWGSDQRIIESARMSTGKGFLGWGLLAVYICRRCNKEIPKEEVYEAEGGGSGHTGCWSIVDVNSKPGDEKLLRYLWENQHATPFEFGGMVVEVKAPIMVFREWHRHRSQGFNEASARYAPLPDENYVPAVERCMAGGGHLTKQATAASGAQALTEPDALAWLAELADVYEHAERVYQSGLRRGVPKELARLPVPVGRYSKMRATTNLRMWLAFATLRTTAKNPAAQWEIRQYADAVGELLAEHFPRTYAVFAEGRK